MIQEFLYPNTFELESGEELEQVKIAYEIHGNPDAEKTIWVCHALSGNTEVTEWWGGLFGKHQLFNLQYYRIICANVIGSCYGSTGPDELDDARDFPLITVKDMVKAHVLLRKALNVEQISILIGASLGGQQAVEWAIEEPLRIQNLILIATNAEHSPIGKAYNEAQRLALLADPTFGKQGGGFEGLKAARAIAMISYRSYEDFELKQSDTSDQLDHFKAPSYVRYQGEKFQNRFKPGAYYTLSKAMDAHNVGRGRLSKVDALKQIGARTLVVGVDSDVLFPLKEQQFLANHIPDAKLGIIKSAHGHDAFLIEYGQLEEIINEFINQGEVESSQHKTIENAAKLYRSQPTTLKPQIVNNEK